VNGTGEDTSTDAGTEESVTLTQKYELTVGEMNLKLADPVVVAAGLVDGEMTFTTVVSLAQLAEMPSYKVTVYGALPPEKVTVAVSGSVWPTSIPEVGGRGAVGTTVSETALKLAATESSAKPPVSAAGLENSDDTVLPLLSVTVSK